MALIEATQLRAGYRPGIDALTDVTFVLDGGVRLGVLGPNGGGKTTLFSVLAGALTKRSGTLNASRCALVPQTERSRLDFPVSALDVALMGALPRLPWWRRPSASDKQSAIAALDQVGLGDRVHKTFGELSGGQRQRVLIARALVQDSPVLLLDEPFTGLDEPSAAALETQIADLAAEGRAVLIATHDLAQARSWDLVLCLNKHQIAFGNPDKVLTREVLKQTYGGEVVELPGGGAVIAPPHHHDHS
jgi:ABC-type Mn2+/Zn2+ transport system ATPase subunit